MDTSDDSLDALKGLLQQFQVEAWQIARTIADLQARIRALTDVIAESSVEPLDSPAQVPQRMYGTWLFTPVQPDGTFRVAVGTDSTDRHLRAVED